MKPRNNGRGASRCPAQPGAPVIPGLHWRGQGAQKNQLMSEHNSALSPNPGEGAVCLICSLQKLASYQYQWSAIFSVYCRLSPSGSSQSQPPPLSTKSTWVL